MSAWRCDRRRYAAGRARGPNGNHGLGRYQHGFPAALSWFQRYLSLPGEDRTWETHESAIARARQALKQALGVGS